MSDDTHAEDFRKHIKLYLAVFAALAVLTVVTVAASYIEFGVFAAVTVGLMIAIVKGSLVALFFMHLSHERKLIYAALILTVAFFFVVLLVPVFALLGANAYPPLYVP